MINKIPITEKGLYKLKQELNSLVIVERPSNIKAIEEARAHGDLSENAEYHAAKERQSFLGGRINELEDVISRSEVIEIDKSKTSERIIFGTTVIIAPFVQVVASGIDPFGPTGRGNSLTHQTYQLVGPYESDPNNNKISVFSPVGKALIGKEECDIIKVKTPSGIILEYEILEIN
jgi:transcription elongation factor GreA